MDDLLVEFIAETREMLEAMQGELVCWEANPADQSRLDTIFRFFHTVKGNCGFFDFPRLEKLAHAAEGALADVRAKQRLADDRLVDGILAITDRIIAIVDAVEAGDPLPDSDDEELVHALEPDPENCGELVAVAIEQQASESIGGKAENVLKPARSIRLPVPLLDRIMAGTSDIVLTRNELARYIRDADTSPAISATFERLSNIVDDVRRDISRMRMQHLDYLFTTLPRLVRDLSAELGKQVMIDIEGGQVELDREMIELLRDPLTHILRNAADHGIETPAERRAAGKNEIGLIHISARQTGNAIMISITDDGRGINTDKLISKAIAAGIASTEECAAMSEQARLALIFQPGVSTAEQVTPVSGRGVGMDVVRTNIEGFGGTIMVHSTAGEGTRLTISLPATLSIIPALTVRVGAQNFGIPRSYVEEIVSAKSQSLKFDRAGDSLLVKFRGERLRCSVLASVLDIETDAALQKSTLLMIRLATGDLFALAVDEVIDHQELVIKPLAPSLTATQLYTGSSLLDDGSLVLMLYMGRIANLEGLITDVNKQSQKSVLAERGKTTETQNIPALLILGLDGQRRIVRMEPVHRIEIVDNAAIRITNDAAKVVIGGEILPLAGTTYGPLSKGKTSVLRLSDGSRELAYAIQLVVDTVSITNEVVPEEETGEIEGVTLFDGQAIEIVDCHWLFSQYGSNDLPEAAKTCRIDTGNPWVRSVLLPMIEAAGYNVIDADSDEIADIAIAMDQEEETPLLANQVIKLTNDPDIADQREDVIYRYDRRTLLESLSSKQRKSA